MESPERLAETGLSVKFSEFVTELLGLTSLRIIDKGLLNKSLNQLNLLDYRHIRITNSNATMLLIHQLCTNIHFQETHLVNNYCLFVINMIKAGASITGRTYSTCEKWLAGALEYAHAYTRERVLAALHSLLRSGPPDIVAQSSKTWLSEKGLPRRILECTKGSYSESEFLAVRCLEAIVMNGESNGKTIPPEQRRLIRETLVEVVHSLSYDLEDKLVYDKIIRCCLRTLSKLTNGKKWMQESSKSVGEILGMVKAFLFHGMKGYGWSEPQCLRPAAMNLPEVINSRSGGPRNKVKSKRLPLKKNCPESKSNEEITANLEIYTNETNFPKYSSDSDTENWDPVKSEWKVRLEAIHLLHAATQEIPAREMFGYWPQIVASGSRHSGRVITRSILKEPRAGVRRSVLGTLSKLIIDAKHFLRHADDSEHPSFLTFFATVASIIQELHLALSLLLSYETNPSVLTQALKCACGLIQGTPYSRLKAGLATKLARNSRPHLLHRDPTVRVSALSVFESFATHEPLTPEIIGILGKQSRIVQVKDASDITSKKTDTSQEEEELEEFEETEENRLEFAAKLEQDQSEIEDSELEEDACREKEISSLLRVSLNYISDREEKGPVRLHALKLLGAIGGNIESLIVAQLESVTSTLERTIQDRDIQVARHACRVTESIAGRLVATRPEDPGLLQFWKVLLAPICALLQQPHMSLREAGCDCLANIGSNVFYQLPRNSAILVVTILFGAARDEESGVRAAATRALGMLTSIPALEEDAGFLMDLGDTVCLGMEDRNLGVRVKACWAMANLCDCLIRRSSCEELPEPVPLENLLPRLYRASLQAAEDNSKVKSNAMRALGGILRLSSDTPLLEDTSLALRLLLHSAQSENDMKVRWNACRAIGFVISHNPDAVLPTNWKDQVFPSLCDLICNSPNFKVRTNAAWALSACKSYDKYLPFLWKSTAIGLENAQHVPSFIEYSHREALVQQLCLTLSHLAARTDVTDLETVWSEICDHCDEVSTHMRHVHNSVLPERASDLVEAKTHFQKLAQTASNPSDRRIATNLSDLFDKPNLYEHPTQKNTF